VTKFSH